MFNLSEYDLWLFDCDGVILQSNPIKTEAMYQVALHFSNDDIAREFKQYHQDNAGVTRFLKFNYLFETLLNKPEYEDEYQYALQMFTDICRTSLLQCKLTNGAESFLTKINKNQDKIIISAGTETELNQIFFERGLAKYFNGIYGGPRTKSEIFNETLKRYSHAKPIFFGDAKADHKVAQEFGVDFVFVSDYTEFTDWQEYFINYPEVKIIKCFTCLT